MSDGVLRPGDELVIIRDCPGHDSNHEVVLLEKGEHVTLIGIERVLVRMGPLTISVDATDMFRRAMILSVDAENVAAVPVKEVAAEPLVVLDVASIR